MKSRFLICWLLLSAFAIAQTPLDQTLIDLEKTVLAAEKKKDMAAASQHLADDFTAVAVDGHYYDRREILGFISYLGVDITPYNFKVLPVNDSAAIVSYDAVFKTSGAAEEEAPPPRYQHFSSVWVKQGDQWKLKFQQATAARVVD
jgi:hypothetical protein